RPLPREPSASSCASRSGSRSASSPPDRGGATPAARSSIHARRARLHPSQRIVQVCLLIVAAIALFGGAVQMVLGQPDTTPRLDNVDRFMAGGVFFARLL